MSPECCKNDSDAGAGVIWWGLRVGTSVQADAKFLRRIFIGLVFLTVVTGAMAGITTVQAMTGGPGACVMFCE